MRGKTPCANRLWLVILEMWKGKRLKPNGDNAFTGRGLLTARAQKTFFENPLTVSKGVATVVNVREIKKKVL